MVKAPGPVVLRDRADGAPGHYCFGRLMDKDSIYWEFWSKGQWVSASEVFDSQQLFDMLQWVPREDWTAEQLQQQIDKLQEMILKKNNPPLDILELMDENLSRAEKELLYAPRYGKGVYPIPPFLLRKVTTQPDPNKSELEFGDALGRIWRVKVAGAPKGYEPRIGTIITYKS